MNGIKHWNQVSGPRVSIKHRNQKVPGSSRGFLTPRPWTWAMSMKRSSGEMPMSLWIACVSEIMRMRTTRTRTTIQNKNLRMETTHLDFRARMYLDTRSKASRQCRPRRVISVCAHSFRNHAWSTRATRLFAFSAGR